MKYTTRNKIINILALISGEETENWFRVVLLVIILLASIVLNIYLLGKTIALSESLADCFSCSERLKD